MRSNSHLLLLLQFVTYDLKEVALENINWANRSKLQLEINDFHFTHEVIYVWLCSVGIRTLYSRVTKAVIFQKAYLSVTLEIDTKENHWNRMHLKIYENIFRV